MLARMKLEDERISRHGRDTRANFIDCRVDVSKSEVDGKTYCVLLLLAGEAKYSVSLHQETTDYFISHNCILRTMFRSVFCSKDDFESTQVAEGIEGLPLNTKHKN